MSDKQMHAARKREIPNENGVPDPSMGQGMFWRSHPHGRRVATPREREEWGAGYHRP